MNKALENIKKANKEVASDNNQEPIIQIDRYKNYEQNEEPILMQVDRVTKDTKDEIIVDVLSQKLADIKEQSLIGKLYPEDLQNVLALQNEQAPKTVATENMEIEQ